MEQTQVLPSGVQVHDDEKPDQHKKQTVNADETKRENVHADSATSTSCESLPQFPEERIVYLDDVVELCSSTTTEGDQRLFKFKTAAPFPKTEISKANHNRTDVDQSESCSDIENSSSKTSVKGSKKRSVSKGKPKTEDIENQIKGENFRRSVQNRSEGESWASEGATDKEMEWANFYKKPRRRRKRRELPPSSDLTSTTYDVFTCNNSNMNNKKSAAKDAKSNTEESSEKNQKMNLSSSLRNKRETLYLRAATLPPERPKESQKVNFPRTNSCPYKQPSHVHPKLPDYDDIAAKFMALKREHLRNNTLKSQF